MTKVERSHGSGRLGIITLLLLSALLIPISQNPFFPSAQAHKPGVPTLSAYGTPNIDGQISPNEYTSCYGPTVWTYPHTYTVYSGFNATYTNVVTDYRDLTFCETNDQTNDYYAFQIKGAPTSNPADTMILLLDNNHDGAVSSNCLPGFVEDALMFVQPSSGPPNFVDMSYCGIPSGLLPNQVPVTPDVSHPGGVTNGMGVMTYSTANGYVFEMSHPMSSGDPYDYMLSPGSTVGWCVYFWDANANRVWDYPIDCYYYYNSPNSAPQNAILYGDIRKLPPASGDICDLAINKTIVPSPLQSGQTATITITVTNVGTAPCLEQGGPTTVTDNPPPVFTVISASGPGWNCNTSVVCINYNTIMQGQWSTITILVTVTGTPGSGTQNCAQVSNPQDANSPNNANDVDCVTEIIVPEFPQGSAVLVSALALVLVTALVRSRRPTRHNVE